MLDVSNQPLPSSFLYKGRFNTELLCLKKALIEAGNLALIHEKRPKRLADKKNAADPYLTEADLAVDSYLRQTLMAAFPEYGWFSEETEVALGCLQRAFCWVVDPIDGTRGFVDGKSAFAISVGLVHQGVPVLGGVYAPKEGVCIYGGIGYGLMVEDYNTGQSSHIKPPTYLNINPEAYLKTVLQQVQARPRARVLVSRREKECGLWQNAASSFQLEAVGSIAYKLALVAAHRADAVVSLRPKSLYDVCAGHALIKAVGGVFIDDPAVPLMYTDPNYTLKGVLATHSPICAGVLASGLQAHNL